MIKVNCDLGERGLDHPVDIELMKYVQIANIACGGHAGDEKSVDCFRKLAEAQNVMITAHLSYPDRKNFGRMKIRISSDALCKSMDDQMRLVPDITAVKFHGALYNDSVVDPALASVLVKWAKTHRINSILTPDDSEMAEACRSNNIRVIAEAFAERRYTLNPKSGRLQLVNRKKLYASIHDCEAAIAQACEIVSNHRVEAIIERENGENVKKWMNIVAETICIHSDSSIALDLAKGLARK